MIFRNPSIPWGAMAGLFLILASELAFLLISDPLTGLPFSEPTADDAVLVAKRGLAKGLDSELLIVGDSSAFMGIKPKVVAEYVDTGVVNLGTLSSFTLAGYADLVEFAVQSGCRPRAVILAILPQAFSVSHDDAKGFSLLSRYLIAYDRPRDSYTPAVDEYWLWWFKKHRLNFFPAEFGGSFSNFTSLIEQDRGFYEEKNNYSGTAIENRRKHFRKDDFALKAFHRLAAFARSHDIPFFVWFSPCPIDSVTAEYVQEFNDFVSSELSIDNSFYLAQKEINLLGQESFGSVTHLRPQFAIDNSRALGEHLKLFLKPSVSRESDSRTPSSVGY